MTAILVRATISPTSHPLAPCRIGFFSRVSPANEEDGWDGKRKERKPVKKGGKELVDGQEGDDLDDDEEEATGPTRTRTLRAA